IIYTNKKFDAMFGYDPGELTGKRMAHLVSASPGMNRQNVMVRIKRELTTKGIVSQEFMLRKKGGSFAWVLASISEYKDPGQALMYILVLQDITERKGTEDALRVSEERFRLLFQTNLDAVLMTARNGDILEANEAASRLFGFTDEELKRIGRKRIVDASDGRLEAALKQRDLTNKFVGELTFKRRDGTKFIGEVSSASFQNTYGEFRDSFVIRDITARKEAEWALKATGENLRLRSQELQEMNNALKVLLEQREQDRRDLEEKVFENVKSLVQPYIEKLKKRTTGEAAVFLNIIESNLHDIVSSYSTKLSGKLIGLTPQERLVASLVRDGKTDKEIAETLHASIFTIRAHRRNIREKLGLAGGKENLRIYLSNIK
ncbi:MAG TPA: PAS domain S-box protein, partial [Dissulfurispiraceae bacterium]|nr:PAS domain S-box protein [Dissulfurispiraceae bacterium]